MESLIQLRHGERFLASKFELIPADTDILISHGPPRGYGDHSGRSDGQPHVGSTALTEAIERIQPRLMVCGHIHSGYGRYWLGDTEIVNAAHVDDDYRPVNSVVEITL
jgi:Icc-related predicted phosphoesterase